MTKPRYKVGTKVGIWEVLEYLGFDTRDKQQSKKAHMYRVRCGHCGAEYRRDQSAINLKGNRCKACKDINVPSNKPPRVSNHDVVMLARKLWR